MSPQSRVIRVFRKVGFFSLGSRPKPLLQCGNPLKVVKAYLLTISVVTSNVCTILSQHQCLGAMAEVIA